MSSEKRTEQKLHLWLATLFRDAHLSEEHSSSDIYEETFGEATFAVPSRYKGIPSVRAPTPDSSPTTLKDIMDYFTVIREGRCAIGDITDWSAESVLSSAEVNAIKEKWHGAPMIKVKTRLAWKEKMLHHFGSMLDWVPVLNDGLGSMTLVNCNPDAHYFQRVATMAIDDEGKQVYHVYPHTLDHLFKAMSRSYFRAADAVASLNVVQQRNDDYMQGSMRAAMARQRIPPFH